MLLSLTGYQAGLLVVAASFISFTLDVALAIPRARPSFPGKRLGVFLGICALFFIAQISAVLVLAEIGEADQPAKEQTTSAQPGTPPPTTQTQTTETTPAQGDPVAGKAIFTGAAGCSGCHTLADASATGTVGPNLDQLKPPYDAVVHQVTNGGAVMPAFKNTLSAQQIQDVAAYVSSVAGQ